MAEELNCPVCDGDILEAVDAVKRMLDKLTPEQVADFVIEQQKDVTIAVMAKEGE